MSFLNTLYGYRLPYNLRIGLSCVICGLFMLPLPLLTLHMEDKDLAFKLCLVCIVIIGCMQGLNQNSSFALGGMLPQEHMGAVMLGLAFSGFASNIFRILCLLILPNDMRLGSYIYFGLSSLILLATAIVHWQF